MLIFTNYNNIQITHVFHPNIPSQQQVSTYLLSLCMSDEKEVLLFSSDLYKTAKITQFGTFLSSLVEGLLDTLPATVLLVYHVTFRVNHVA